MPGMNLIFWGLIRFEETVLVYFFLVNSFYALLVVLHAWAAARDAAQAVDQPQVKLRWSSEVKLA